jgi:urea transport system ATP-binding protein
MEQILLKWRPYERAARGIGYVPQGRQIFPLLSVEENLSVGLEAANSGERIIPENIFTTFPVLDQMRKRKGGDLSGGQQQQLAIARALVTQPKLLVLDEPTEGIQPNVITQIGEIIRSLVEEQGNDESYLLNNMWILYGNLLIPFR